MQSLQEQPEKLEEVKALLVELLSQLGVSAKVEFEASITMGDMFNLTLSNPYLLIGQKGATLKALEDILQLMASRKLETYIRFGVDVDDYRRKREWFLKETAKAASEKVRHTGKSLTLEPMPNYERRLIHAYLQDPKYGVTTESIGSGSTRKIMIKLNKTPSTN